MSRADWGFLEHLLEEGQEYSTGIGRVWLTVLFLFRMLVLGTAAETAWDDEQSDFVCNTKQPGCTAVCYDKAFPISHFRYFVLQVIFVSTPTIFYFGYVALRAGDKRKDEEKLKECRRQRSQKTSKDLKDLNDHNLEVIVEEDEVEQKSREEKSKISEVPKLKGRLLCAYVASIALKVLLEICFIVGLWFLYGFVIEPRYECQRFPCPHTVDCFVSRPTEKTIFTVYMQVVAVISVLLNVVELLHLLQLAITYRLEKKYHGQHEIIQFIGRNPPKSVPAETFEEKERVLLPIANNSYPSEWDNREPQLTEDTLPSYLNCINNVKHKSSTNNLHKKQHKTDKNDKPSKPGHYV